MKRTLRKEIIRIFKMGWSFELEIFKISVACFNNKYPEYNGALNDTPLFTDIETTIRQQMEYKLKNGLNTNQFLDLLQNLNFIN